MYAGMRTLRLADGPDEVHRRTDARIELSKHQAAQANVEDIKSKSAQVNSSFPGNMGEGQTEGFVCSSLSDDLHGAFPLKIFLFIHYKMIQ